MKLRTTLGPCLLALSLGLAAGPALADDDCDVPVEHWQSRDAVRQLAQDKGWEIQRLKIDDGCYEIRGLDAQGRAFKAKLDPQTLEIVKWKGGGESRERDRDQRHRESDADARPADGAGPGPSSPNPLFAPGSAPRGQIE